MNRATTRLLLPLAGLLLALGIARLMSSGKTGSAEPASNVLEAEVPRGTDKGLVPGPYRAVPPPVLRKRAEAKSPISPPASFRDSIREQLVAAEPDLIACLAELDDPSGVEGRATLTFIMAPGKQGEILIEDTGVDFDETTIANEALVRCMSRSAEHMIFASVPEGVDAVSVGRQVVVHAGIITENRLSEYANLRDSD